LIVLGIDPGMAILGYGVIEQKGHKMDVVDYGTVLTDSGMKMPDRLVRIFDGVEELIQRFKPDVVSVEELFFNKNSKTALTIGHARGVAILTAAKNKLEIYEYTPLQVKQAVVGYGRAEKAQIQQMVKILLNLKEIPKPDDAADALAVAICHIHNSNMIGRLG